MVYKFRLISDESDDFRREIEIDSTDTFLSLKNAICESVGYDRNIMCSFFICEDDWEKKTEITLEDMGADSDVDIYMMDDTVIGDMVEDEGQKLIFTFDYLTDRSLFMEMREIKTGCNLSEPVCTLKRGEAPAQTIDFDEFEAKNPVKGATSTDFVDEDFYGSDSYNDDEFEAGGFSDMDMDSL